MSAQVLLGLQLIPSRQINPYANPSLISFGVIKGGERNNIIPEFVDLKGTIRSTEGDLAEIPAVGGAEDFSFFAQKVPGLFVFLGITPRDQDMAQAAPNHSPRFYLDESALVVGVRVMAGFAVDYLYQHLP